MIPASTRHNARAVLTIAAQQPSMVLWYLQSKLRGALLPLERALGDGRSRPPRFVTLKPTLRCNLRCEFCRFVANGDVFGKRDWLELSDWKRVIDEIAPYRPYLCLTGGEPTMYPHLAELLAHINRHGLRSVLTTNGTLLEQRAEALMASPPGLVILSLDGPREVHDAVRRQSGTFDRALRGVRALQRLRKREHVPYLVINTAITGHTYESALEMVEVAREFGAFALNFQHFWFMTRPMVDAHNVRLTASAARRRKGWTQTGCMTRSSASSAGTSGCRLCSTRSWAGRSWRPTTTTRRRSPTARCRAVPG
jgi:sulfatase maturation enzyme AslB (radical SAM superfamily)